jgi:class 3 adenylate cyclase
MSSPAPNFSSVPDQRLLAAIVFTDVVGFSKRMQTEEAGTLKLLERDFVTMRAFSAMHSGRVIKSTGDGLLLFFASAVQAVEWCLKTQRHFADQAAELEAKEVLKHRMGIHLGDVVVAAGDVMGDGVNIAARVQVEAPAGGICISQEVYAVVKNKMKLDVVRLEPRALKNINELVQMYQVLLEPPRQRLQPVAGGGVQAEAPAAEARRTAGWVKWVVGLGGLAAVGAAGFFLFQADQRHQRELVDSQGKRDALSAALRADAAETPAPVEAKPGTAPAVETPQRPAVAKKAAAPAGPDFAKLAVGRAAGAAGSEDQRVLQEANASMGAIETWTAETLPRYTRDTPLLVQPLRSNFRGSTIFIDTDHQLYSQEGGARRRLQWAELSPEARGNIMTALIHSSPVPPSREVLRSAEAFAYVHRLPEMAEALIRERGAK